MQLSKEELERFKQILMENGVSKVICDDIFEDKFCCNSRCKKSSLNLEPLTEEEIDYIFDKIDKEAAAEREVS